MGTFDYFSEYESEQFSFYRIPKLLFSDAYFDGLSTDAKLLYGILLDRIGLSRRNGWVDQEGHVYIIYTLEEMAEVMNMSVSKIGMLLKELNENSGIGLIERKRRGMGKPNIIYVKNFTSRQGGELRQVQDVRMPKSTNQDCQDFTIKNRKIWQSRLTDFNNQDCENLAGNDTKYYKTDFYTDRNDTGTPLLPENNLLVLGRFRNVIMTKEELGELKKMFPGEWNGWIERLSEYMASTGKTYQNHMATICLWAARKKEEINARDYDCAEEDCL